MRVSHVIERVLRNARKAFFVISFHTRSWAIRRERAAIGNTTPLADVRTLVFFAAIYLYVSGWSFDYYFYRHFGVPLASLNVEYYSILVYSYNVITSPAGAITFVSGFLAVAFFNHVVRSRLSVALILCIMVPCFFGIGKELGTRTAELTRSHDDGQRISFVFKARDLYPPEVMALNDRNSLRILSQTRERYIVFYQPPAADGTMPRAQVIQISATDIVMARIRIPDIERR
jgi:hypothetical protein